MISLQKRLILKRSAGLSLKALVMLLVVAVAGAETVRIELTGNINLRVRENYIRDQVEEIEYLKQVTNLPKGTVIEVDVERLNKPAFLPYSKNMIQSRYGFVEGIKIVSLPGRDSQSQRKKIEALNAQNLFISKGNLNTRSRQLSVTATDAKMELKADAPAYKAELDVDPSTLRSSTEDVLAALQQLSHGTKPDCSNCARDDRASNELIETVDDLRTKGMATTAISAPKKSSSATPSDTTIQSTIDRLNQLAQQQAPDLTPAALEQAQRCLEEKGHLFTKRDVITIADYHQPSRKRRLFKFDLVDGKVTQEYVTHGNNSGEDLATRFSNREGSHQTSLGCYRTGETYQHRKHGLALRLDGLDDSNDNARKRGIVIHGATYAEESVLDRQNRLGMSQGCPAVPPKFAEELINDTKGGSLFLAAGPGLS